MYVYAPNIPLNDDLTLFDSCAIYRSVAYCRFLHVIYISDIGHTHVILYQLYTNLVPGILILNLYLRSVKR